MAKRPISRQRRDPAQEYIILVGAPCNTFNGYFYTDPNTGGDVPSPAPANTSQVKFYVHGPTGAPVENDPRPTGTHDKYWANFIYSAVKAVELGVIRPKRGDILTFLIWRPALLLRMQRDWAASPYNLALHPVTAYNPGDVPYDRRRVPELQGFQKLFEQARHPKTSPIQYGTSEPDIDHEILMSTTSEGRDGGFHKRAITNDDYENAIRDIPRRLVQGSKFGRFPPATLTVPPMREVQVKLVMIDSVQSLFDYLAIGIAPAGERWKHWEEIRDETQMGADRSCRRLSRMISGT